MTDTDLITVATDTAAATHDAKPEGALSTMVLPELRALATQAGVKGTSGMRKNELIAAISEVRGNGNGTSAPVAPRRGAR